MPNPAANIRASHAGKPVRGRGRTYLEFDEPDGQITWVGATGPIHKQVAGTWVELDSGFDPDPGSHDFISRELDGVVIQARANVAAVPLLVTDEATGESLQFQPMAMEWTNDLDQLSQVATPTGTAGTPADNEVRWPDAYGAGRHLTAYAHIGGGLVWAVDLDGPPPAPPQFIIDGGNPHLRVSFNLTVSNGLDPYIDGVRWDRRNNTTVTVGSVCQWRLNSDGTTPVFTMRLPNGTDEQGEPHVGRMSLRRQGPNLLLRTGFAKSWLDAATYPLRLEP